jgi:nitrite reductase/ring-hydroxylating ferredoxin subunit
MTVPANLSRRDLFMKIGIFLNGVVGVILAAPILRYVLSPIVRGQRDRYDSWVSLGDIAQFPSGQTRLATYQNPSANQSDGTTADIPCWVRNVDGQPFQVFAVNCAHLGCPVRWFPQSGLFMCPCHGGVYYRDGSRASGPPERGLFQYDYKIIRGLLLIKAGQLPTPGQPSQASNLVQKIQSCA